MSDTSNTFGLLHHKPRVRTWTRLRHISSGQGFRLKLKNDYIKSLSVLFYLQSNEMF